MDPVIARRIRKKILGFAGDPLAQNNNVKKLRGVDGFRLRVGDWRVIYVLQQQTIMITVISIGHRSEIYE